MQGIDKLGVIQGPFKAGDNAAGEISGQVGSLGPAGQQHRQIRGDAGKLLKAILYGLAITCHHGHGEPLRLILPIPQLLRHGQVVSSHRAFTQKFQDSNKIPAQAGIFTHYQHFIVVGH